MSVAVIGSSVSEETVEIIGAWREFGIDVALISPADAYVVLRPGDVAVVRLDVLPTVDGVQEGLLAVFLLERRGVRVLNSAAAVLAAHDKLRTARLLAKAGVPHPATVHVSVPGDVDLRLPVVIKPRYGSWGTDVALCRSRAELRLRFDELRERPWFRRHGALVQEAVPSLGHDLRVIVAGGCVVGAAERVAAAGEWRTNVSCGGSLRPAVLSAAAEETARAAVSAIGADFVGVDLMPQEDGRFVVLELNAAVDFSDVYSFRDGNVYAAAASALGLLPTGGVLHPVVRSVPSGQVAAAEHRQGNRSEHRRDDDERHGVVECQPMPERISSGVVVEG